MAVELREAETNREESSGEEEEEVEQPLSPAARIFHSPRFNCYILAIMGCKNTINPQVLGEGFKHTLLKHPRFHSKLVTEGGKLRWKPTRTNPENHLVVPDVDPEMECPDQFIEDYISNLTTVPLDMSKPLWEFHILNVKSSGAEAVGIFKIHHSIGDGMSLISLLLACFRKSSDPEALPQLPASKNSASNGSHGFLHLFLAVWSLIRLIWNTVSDLVLFVATVMFLKDTKTPIKGEPGVERNTKRFVHRTVSLDDIRLVKNAMKMTVNDVILGITQAGISRYLNRKYGEIEKEKGGKQKSNHIPKHIRLRATILVNIRPITGIQALAEMMKSGSMAKWGNKIGYVCIPFAIGLQDDPLDHLRIAKATIDKKKLSLEAPCTHLANWCLVKLFGPKASAFLAQRALSHTTMSFSNLVGPVEEVTFHGHPMTYLAPSVYGHPQALTIHFQSYINKMIISLAVDPTLISDPELLFDDFEESIKTMKKTLLEKGIIKDPNSAGQ